MGKRDLLKAAADAASVAATLRLRALPANQDPATVRADLQSVAERYVWLNLGTNLRGEALEKRDVAVILNINRSLGTVGVEATAPIGRALLGVIMDYSGLDAMTVGPGAEAGAGAVWAVLAIDTSYSMSRTLMDMNTDNDAERRIGMVTVAAKEFVAEVNPRSAPSVAIGVVPWDHLVGRVLNPTSNRSAVETALDELPANGWSTASSRGMKKSRELLSRAPEDARRAIVLLTDGEDNRDLDGRAATMSNARATAPRNAKPRRRTALRCSPLAPCGGLIDPNNAQRECSGRMRRGDARVAGAREATG